MKEKVLTAKEWLEEETNTKYACRTGSDMCIISGEECHKFMEEYATYRNKVLQGEIMLFSLQLTTIAKSTPYDGILKDIKVQFDEHFGITCTREGKIN